MDKKLLYKGKVAEFNSYTIDGVTREMLDPPQAACILAVDENGFAILVKQNRVPFGLMLEIPAGKIEFGELPQECAVRELEEETGFIAKDVHHITSFYPSVGNTTEMIHCYSCDVDSKDQQEQKLDDGEKITIVKLKMQDLEEMIKYKEIQDSKTIISFLAGVLN